MHEVPIVIDFYILYYSGMIIHSDLNTDVM